MSIVEVAACIVAVILGIVAWYTGRSTPAPTYVNALLAFLALIVLLLLYTAGPSPVGGG